MSLEIVLLLQYYGKHFVIKIELEKTVKLSKNYDFKQIKKS